MLGGAVGLPASNHKQQLLHRPSTPIDLEAWRDVLLQSAKNHDDSSMDCLEGSSDVSGTASVGAINLSSRPSSAPTAVALSTTTTTTNHVEGDMQDDNSLKNHVGQERNATPINEETCTPVGNGKISPVPFIPPGLQQLQQLLQSHLAGFNPAQLQQLMQQQQQILSHHQQMADAGRKQLEQVMHQLQEQLQINLLQQSHLMQAADKTGPKTQGAMQQLQMQQQQLISQLQLVQQRILLLPNFHQRKDDFPERAWKENAREHLQKTLAHKNGPFGVKFNEEQKEEMRNNLNNNNNNNNLSNNNNNNNLIENHEKFPMQHPLFSNGVCQWPGCESHYNDLVSFLKHVGSEHVLDDKSTAQARVQMQIVAQLEHSLHKERDRLQAMMAHLHLTKEMQNSKQQQQQQQQQHHQNNKSAGESEKNNMTNEKGSNEERANDGTPLSPLGMAFNDRPKSPPKLRIPPGMNHPHGGPPHGLPAHPPGSLAAAMQGFGHLPSMAGGMGLHPPTPLSALTAAARSPNLPPSLQPAMSSMGPPVRRRLSDKGPMPMSSVLSVGLPYLFDRAGLDIAQEIHRNREFYRTHDVRPPFTYASLIRQAVVESPEHQLTLHEIYSWFTTTFAYFRGSQASWKNAIRTNLSLHKCFVRYEDDFGSFWMVDDAEFMKRRHLSRGRPRNVHSKSPSFGPSPSMYSEALNASLQSALGFGDGPLPFLGQSLAEASMLHQQHRERQQQREREHEEKNQFNERCDQNSFQLNWKPPFYITSESRSPSVDFGGKFPESHQFLSPSSLQGDSSPGGERNNNNDNSELGIKRESEIEANARRLARKRAAEIYDDDEDLTTYDDDIIEDDLSLNDISPNDNLSNELSSNRESIYRHHRMHFEEKDKNEDNDENILSTRRMVDDEISSNDEKRVKRENF